MLAESSNKTNSTNFVFRKFIISNKVMITNLTIYVLVFSIAEKRLFIKRKNIIKMFSRFFGLRLPLHITLGGQLGQRPQQSSVLLLESGIMEGRVS